MKVVIVGAGNMGLAMTAYLAVYHKADVFLFTKKNHDSLHLCMEDQGVSADTQNFVTTGDPVKAFSNADIIFVTYPAFLRKKFISDCGKYIQGGSCLGFVPGYGGAEYFCQDLIKKGVTIFGLQRVPYVARANGYQARILSRKKTIFVSSIPASKVISIGNCLENLLDITTVAIKDYLSITLTPTNPIIHIAGLWGAFRNYDSNVGYSEKEGFYDQWDDATSKLLFDYDSEVQEICKKLEMFELNSVTPLPVYYESNTPEKLTKKLKSIESFKVVKVPLKADSNKKVVDLNNRMFTEDFPFGVVVYKDIATLLKLQTPVIDGLLAFYKKISGIEYNFDIDKSTLSETGAPSANGLENLEDFIKFYKQEGKE